MTQTSVIAPGTPELRAALQHAVRLLAFCAGREAGTDPGQAAVLLAAVDSMTAVLDTEPPAPVQAAVPLAQALRDVQALGLGIPPVDILISYVGRGCVVRVADRSSAYREEVEECVRSAFVAAGWSVSARYQGGLAIEHPSEMTRLSHDFGQEAPEAP
ncbi:hypothetical protein [Streptomyces sp. NPDC006971]|uniref:hypothetical protein n=1 Tax=Streptomyces sp. NPDC006971 TaxID=3154784 RepID=UPI0033F0BF0F